VRGVRVNSNLFDHRHNPLLQIHREPGKCLAKDFVVTTLYTRILLP
jgi:hypothetical protein